MTTHPKNFLKSQFARNLKGLRKDFIADCEELISGGQPMFALWHPLVLGLMAYTPRIRRSDRWLWKMAKEEDLRGGNI